MTAWIITVDRNSMLYERQNDRKRVCRYRSKAAADVELRTLFAKRDGFACRQASEAEIDAYERMINGGPPVRKRLSKGRE